MGLQVVGCRGNSDKDCAHFCNDADETGVAACAVPALLKVSESAPLGDCLYISLQKSRRPPVAKTIGRPRCLDARRPCRVWQPRINVCRVPRAGWHVVLLFP
jgi:hypothetical protein